MKISFNLSVSYEHAALSGHHQDLFTDTLQFDDALDDDARIGFDRKAFGELLFNLYLLVFVKSAQYGNSWQRRGEIRGPISNIDRKYDRIMHSIQQWEEAGINVPDARIDGSADLAAYCLLYLSSFLKKQYPDAYGKWWAEEVQAFIDRYRVISLALEKGVSADGR